MENKIIVACAQLAPVFLDKKSTTDKTCLAIKEAASNNAQLIVFPESFIPAYPDWVWLIPPGKKQLLNDLYIELIENAVTDSDDCIKQICEVARESKMNVVIGITERNSEQSNGSLYNTQLYINDEGKILGKHRKLVPTAGERIVWTGGDGSTLNVFDTNIGKLGGLICWENYMPLARQALYNKGVQIYVASTWDSSEMWLASMKHIAKEGGMFVISCCIALRKDQIPDKYEFKKMYAENKEWINPGNSVIISPNGDVIKGPVNMKEEIFYAELDLKKIYSSKWILDTAGHYSRNDVFHFKVMDDSK